MASAPQGMPLLYKDLTPLQSGVHGDWRLRSIEGAQFLKNVHAIPLLSEEILIAHRSHPIVFSTGENVVPLALLGLNDGVNTVVDDRGMFPENTYVPAYVRRYPFMLAKLNEASDDLSLCFDPTSDVVGPFEDGEPIFEDGQPSERTKAILGFCESFEQGSQVTAAFGRELADQKLLTDGEFKVEVEAGQPYVYRGFQIISEEAVKNLRGDVARKWLQNGMMPLIYAHLFSLGHMTNIFNRQREQGKLPPPNLPMPA